MTAVDPVLAALDTWLAAHPGPPRKWDARDDFIPDDPDLYVSESDARRMQQAYDNWLEREAS